MSRLFYHVMQDNLGNLLFDVTGTIRHAGTGALATIYGDEALTVIVPNPMTNHPSFGSFKFYLPSGDFDFYMAKSGYTFETLTGLQGLGSMAQQDANAVAITGGVASFQGPVESLAGFRNSVNIVGSDVFGLLTSVTDAGGTNRWNVNAQGTAPNFFGGRVGIGGSDTGAQVTIKHQKSGLNGVIIQPTDNDTGGLPALLLRNLAGIGVGSIVSNATTTAYNTTSDARLKRDIAPLAGALDVVRALKPVSFLWKADGSPGRGLVAQEVAAVVPGVVSGDGAGEMPMGIDYSKLVPYLIGALKELTAQVELLTARCDAAGA